MKHIVKVETLQNIPETRPLIAMDNNGNLKWLAYNPSQNATLLYGSKKSSLYPYIDLQEYYEFVEEIEIDGVTYYKWLKTDSEIDGIYILTETRDFSNINFENPYHVTAYYYEDGSIAYEDLEDYVIYYGGNIEPTVIIDIPYHDTSNMDTNGHLYVDLGLPSGAKWATSLVGATNGDTAESWYGNYYAWGELQTKTYYDWTDPNNATQNYKYANGSYNTLTKYCNMPDYGYNGYTDNLKTLELMDDVAHLEFGGDWHMPDSKLLCELMLYTNNEWVENYNDIEGLNGRVFTSKVNGNTLFIPAAGCRSGSAISDVGSFCRLWSSRLYLGNPRYACYLYFSSSNIYIDNDDRFSGFSVCPVLY